MIAPGEGVWSNLCLSDRRIADLKAEPVEIQPPTTQPSPATAGANRAGGGFSGGGRIDEQRIRESGLLVLDITAADEDRACRLMPVTGGRWAMSGRHVHDLADLRCAWGRDLYVRRHPRTDTEACLPSFPAQVVLAVPGHAMGLPVGLAFS
ncbi:DUF6207 family protein (plasmid) [Streptomyces sp. NBC_01220]|uniref:DUF6207 family protein n=1 Tax=Streptomyces poriferorum TaxID=2798799 RepID=A0ABY9J1I9_9ACTN|nr:MULTISPECIES: DUF6207 family protein [unclassified Streptomyces]MDP5309340.1 DUF6207 family protein [Streptomyces sp. Alt4]WLQ61455.1 DUF6207 family protein [Streptomyces sp. Alt2]WSQ49302.1 DUF6207 family protein [Streptomyces sp. NBC_01220]